MASAASEARVAAAKHLLDQAVSSRVEHAALSAAFAEKIRAYDEATSLQVPLFRPWDYRDCRVLGGGDGPIRRGML